MTDDQTYYELDLVDDGPAEVAAPPVEDELAELTRKRKGEWSARGLTADERARYNQWSARRRARQRAQRERGVFEMHQTWMA
jgi:hypothetical protein